MVLSTEPRKGEGDHPEPDARQPPENPEFLSLYRDSRYVVLVKPADVRMDGKFEHTVERFVLSLMSEEPAVQFDGTVRLVHRLDYATSGVVLCGLTRSAAGIAAQQFQTRSVKKEYLAVLHGHVAEDCAEWNWAIADGEGFRMTTGTVHIPGRCAKSICEVIARGTYNGANVTKVRLLPETGRRHQLRVHALAAGHPIVGDATYCEDDASRFPVDGGFLCSRMMLHALQLEIGLPPPDVRVYGLKSGRRLVQNRTFTAPDPFTPLALFGLVLPDVSEA